MDNTAKNDIVGDLAAVFGANFLDETVCREWILRKIHPMRPVCPHCGRRIARWRLSRFWMNGRMECDDCHRWFNALTGTALSGCRLGFADFVMMAAGFHWGFSNQEIARLIAFDPETVRIWRHKWAAHAL